jgi:hypothetical protein
MKQMKTGILVGLLVALSLSAWGAVYDYGTRAGGSPIGVIPDNNSLGFSDAHTLSGLPSPIATLNLTFVLQGGFSSDLSGYLRLGNLITSPAYSLSTFIHSQTLSEITPITYTIDLTSTFATFDPNNTWTLFFADTSAGGATTFNGWSLNIEPVPEPIHLALGIFGALFVAGYFAKRLLARKTHAA